MKTPHEFYLETDGKIIDIDGSYGGQCWDLFALFCQEYCNYIFNCPFTGYVADLWYHFYDLHLNVYFDQITDRHQLQDGDWLIWDKSTNPLCWISDSSHIAMFRKYNDDNPEQNIILTQNPGCTHQQDADFLGFVGALRPKCYETQDKTLPNPVEENKEVDQLKVNCNNTMRVRLGHNLDAEIIGFAIEGYYNILNTADEVDYTWCEVEENKWIAVCSPSCEFIPKEEPTPDENIFVKIIKFIIEILKKILNKGDK